jgi:phosphohistidine phosphatase
MEAGGKQLFLLRHAKSSWDDLEAADHDRGLAPRGRRAAKLMAKHLRHAAITPSLVLCSSAQRTRETLDRLDLDGEVKIERELYGASERELVERLRRVPESVQSVMVIAHNPGIQGLALTLARGGDELDRMEQKFPTGALATLTFSGDWHELGPGCAEPAGFVRPRDLE